MDYKIIVLLIMSVLFIALWLIVLFKGQNKIVNRTFNIFVINMAIWSFGLAMFYKSADPKASLFWTDVLYLAGSLIPAAFLLLSFVFPSEGVTVSLFKRILIFMPNITLFVLFFFTPIIVKEVAIVNGVKGFIYGPGHILWDFQFATIFAWAFIRFIKKYQHSTGVVKTSLRYIILGTLIGVILATITNVIMPWFNRFELLWLGPPLTITWLGSIVYAIVRYRLMDIKVAVTSAAIFAVVYTLVLGVPFGLTGWFRAELMRIFGENWFWLPMLVLLCLATLGPFVFIFLQKKAEAAILKKQRNSYTIAAKAAKGMTLVRNLESIVNSIVDMITETLGITWASIYLDGRDKKNYSFCVTKGGKNCDIIIDSRHLLVKYLTSIRKPVILGELKREYDDRRDIFIKEIIDMMNKLEADVLVPCLIESDLIGFLVLSPKKSGEIYSSEDINVLSNLADQAALAIENAQFLKEREEMQGKLREAETLTTIRDLLGSFNHELYNLLTPIATTLQKITMGDYEKRPERLKPDAQKSVDTTFFIKTYLGWVREYVESGNKIASYQLSELVNGGISYSKDKMEKQNIKTQINVSPKIFVVGYESLPLIFRHLILHSVYGYGMEQGGTINISARILEDGATIEITQLDTGHDLCEYIKEKSTMGGTKFAEKGKLGGVSYFIAQAVVFKHRGLFELEPTGGKGTKFIIRLPLDFNKISA